MSRKYAHTRVKEGRDSIDALSTRCGLNGLGLKSRQKQEIFACPKLFSPTLSPYSLLFNWYHGSFPGVKWTGREAEHLPPSNAWLKKRWSNNSVSPICLHRANRGLYVHTPAQEGHCTVLRCNDKHLRRFR